MSARCEPLPSALPPLLWAVPQTAGEMAPLLRKVDTWDSFIGVSVRTGFADLAAQPAAYPHIAEESARLYGQVPLVALTDQVQGMMRECPESADTNNRHGLKPPQSSESITPTSFSWQLRMHGPRGIISARISQCIKSIELTKRTFLPRALSRLFSLGQAPCVTWRDQSGAPFRPTLAAAAELCSAESGRAEPLSPAVGIGGPFGASLDCAGAPVPQCGRRLRFAMSRFAMGQSPPSGLRAAAGRDC